MDSMFKKILKSLREINKLNDCQEVNNNFEKERLI